VLFYDGISLPVTHNVKIRMRWAGWDPGPQELSVVSRQFPVRLLRRGVLGVIGVVIAGGLAGMGSRPMRVVSRQSSVFSSAATVFQSRLGTGNPHGRLDFLLLANRGAGSRGKGERRLSRRSVSVDNRRELLTIERFILEQCRS